MSDLLDNDFEDSVEVVTEADAPKKPEKDSAEPEVEVVDDAPPADQGKWVASDDDDEPEPVNREELESYSKKVQDRINKQTARINAERRRANEKERELEEAVNVTSRLLQENNLLKEMVEKGEKVLHKEHTDHLDAELGAAKLAYKDAREAEDTDAIVEAQMKIADLSARKTAAANRQFTNLPRTDVQQLFPQRQQPAAATPSEAALEWRDRNPWFGEDTVMTSAAMGFHTEIVGRDGVAADSPEYYRRIDEGMRKHFPDRFAKKPPRETVAPATRTGHSDKAPRKVVLTESQVRLSHRLGITPEQYAQAYVKFENETNAKNTP